MSSSLVGSAECILLVKDIPHGFTESNLLARCESIGHSCIVLYSQPESGGSYTVKLLAPSPEAVKKISEMIGGMRSDQTWISTEVRLWADLNFSERSQYPAHVLLDPGMLQSLRLSLTQPKKILDLDRRVADLKVELAGYQKSSGTSGSRERIQVIKLGNEFLRAVKIATPTAYQASQDVLSRITALKQVMSNPDSPPTVPQLTSALSSCFLPLFQHLNFSHEALLTTYQELEATRNELATVKAMNEGLQQQASQYSFDSSAHALSTPTQSTQPQSEIEALKEEMCEDQARLTGARQENKKLKLQNLELKEKVESFREQLRLSEEIHSTPANSRSIEPPDVAMVDGSAASLSEVPQDQSAEIQVLEREQEMLIRSLEGEKNKRLGVEMELGDLKAEYEMQEKMMIDWFLELVRVTNGDEYLKKLRTLKDIRPTPPRASRDSFYPLLG